MKRPLRNLEDIFDYYDQISDEEFIERMDRARRSKLFQMREKEESNVK